MTIGFICQPCDPKSKEREAIVERSPSTDSRDFAIRYLSMALVVAVIAILILAMSRQVPA
jgi:hypothetical protein